MIEDKSSSEADTPSPEPSMPRIEFPCAYPVKIMGLATEVFMADVVSVCQRHAPEVGEEHVKTRPSAQGNYIAVTVVIQATGIEQLQSLFADLKATPSVKMVL